MSGPEPEEGVTVAQDQLYAGLDRARGADNMEEACRAGHDVLFETGRVLRGEAGIAEADHQRQLAVLELLSSIALNVAQMAERAAHPMRMVLPDEVEVDAAEADRLRAAMTGDVRHGCCGVQLGQLHEPTCHLSRVVSSSVAPTWRAGRHRSRNIYAQRSIVPGDADVFVGSMETPELAALVIHAVNAYRPGLRG